MNIITHPRPAWHENPERLMLRFLSRLMPGAVCIDEERQLRLEFDLMNFKNGWAEDVYALYDLKPVLPVPLWAARVKDNGHIADGVPLDTIVAAVIASGFNPMRVTFARELTLCHVHRWGDLPRLMARDDGSPVIVNFV